MLSWLLIQFHSDCADVNVQVVVVVSGPFVASPVVIVVAIVLY